MGIYKAPLTAKLFRGALSVTGLRKEMSLSSEEMQVISPQNPVLDCWRNVIPEWGTHHSKSSMLG